MNRKKVQISKESDREGRVYAAESKCGEKSTKRASVCTKNVYLCMVECERHARYISIPHNNNQRSKCRYFVLALVKIPKQPERNGRARAHFYSHTEFTLAGDGKPKRRLMAFTCMRVNCVNLVIFVRFCSPFLLFQQKENA